MNQQNRPNNGNENSQRQTDAQTSDTGNKDPSVGTSGSEQLASESLTALSDTGTASLDETTVPSDPPVPLDYIHVHVHVTSLFPSSYLLLHYLALAYTLDPYDHKHESSGFISNNNSTVSLLEITHDIHTTKCISNTIYKSVYEHDSF